MAEQNESLTEREQSGSARRELARLAALYAKGGSKVEQTRGGLRVTDPGGNVTYVRAAKSRYPGKSRRRQKQSSIGGDPARLERLIDELGNNQLASLMGVSRSQPSRWRSGAEGMGPENRRRLIDLDYAFGRLEQLFTPRQAGIWLSSENAHLGARPIDVLRIRGVTPVIAAIDAEAEGAIA